MMRIDRGCFTTSALLLLALSSSASIVQGEDAIRVQQDPSETHDAIELRNNLFLQAAEWDHFDVLMKFDTFYGKERRVTDIPTTRFIRLAVDAKERLAFCFQRFEFDDANDGSTPSSEKSPKSTENLLPRSIEPSSGRRIAANLLVAKNGTGMIYRFPGPKSPIGTGISTANKSIFFFVGPCDLPDFRCLGATNFPTDIREVCFFTNYLQHMHDPDVTREQRKQKQTVTYEYGKIVVSGSLDFQSPNGPYSMHWTNRYDAATLMPESQIAFRKQDSEVLPVWDESYEWTEIDGNFLPTSAIVEAFHRDPTGKLLHARYHTLELRWKSFRQPLDPSLFDDDLKSDMPRMMKLVEWTDEP